MNCQAGRRVSWRQLYGVQQRLQAGGGIHWQDGIFSCSQDPLQAAMQAANG